jgi:hypothetical protein
MTFVSGLMSEAVRLAEQEEVLRAKLARIADIIPGIEPSAPFFHFLRLACFIARY